MESVLHCRRAFSLFFACAVVFVSFLFFVFWCAWLWIPHPLPAPLLVSDFANLYKLCF
ncbi:hypothetical protein LguiA_026070 [Lonicera macranthoides]